MNLTARALGQKPRHLWTLPADEALRVYAEFTRFHLGTGIDHQILQRLNDEAYRMGWLLRRVFFLRRPDQTLLFLIALYQAIGINLEGQLPGRLCFRRCFFSRYYTPETCLAASALDQGIMRGLMGSGTLHFQQRITEGCNHCLATFV